MQAKEIEMTLQEYLNEIGAIAKYDLQGYKYGDSVGDLPDAKDFARIEDMIKKSQGDRYKIRAYARNMANAIGSPDKAERRAGAALVVLSHEFDREFAKEIAALFRG